MTIKNGIVLGLDFGKKRLGVATGNTLTRKARALCTINRISKKTKSYNPETFFAEIAKILQQWHPIAVIIGLPKHLDGSDSQMTQLVKNFAVEFQQRFSELNISVEFSDERLTSTIAESILKDNGISYSKKGNAIKPMIDAVSAEVILQEWLNNL